MITTTNVSAGPGEVQADVALFSAQFLAGVGALGLGAHLDAVLHGVVTKSWDDGLLHVVPLVLLAGAVSFAWVAYRVTATALWGSSLGRSLLGVRVVDAGDGVSAPGWGKAWARWRLPQGLGLVPLPGTGLLAYLWAAGDQHRQGLHDKAAGTLVIHQARHHRPD